MNATRVAVLIGTGAVAALGAGFAGSGVLLGMIAVVLIVLLAVLGLPAGGQRSLVVMGALATWGIAFCVLIALAYGLHDPYRELAMIGGFPAATAILVYGTTPVGIAMGLIYGFAFDRTILPEQRQHDFLARFGKE